MKIEGAILRVWLAFNYVLKRICIDLVYYNGIELWPRKNAERNKTLYLYKNHFCLIWKSQGVNFKKAIEELNSYLKVVDKYIPEESVNSNFKCEFIPKKIESQLTTFVVHDLETHNTERARSYCISFCRLSN